MNMWSRAGQRAGDGSAQLQVAGDLIVQQGITEERALEIADARARAVIAEYAGEAQKIAEERIQQLNTRMVDVLSNQSRLEALAEPAVLLQLQRGQESAASTERESDHDLIARLIGDFAERRDNRPVRAGVARAVEVIDKLDSSALRAITLHAALEQYSPLAIEFDRGMSTLNALFEDLLEVESLPRGSEWIEHAEVLDVLRIQSFGSFSKFHDWYWKRTPSYVCVGVAEGSPEADMLRADLEREQCGPLLIDHKLRPGWLRLASPSISSLLELYPAMGAERMERLRPILAQAGMETPDPEAQEKFFTHLGVLPAFQALMSWWDQLEPSFRITSVGRVLARANAQRLDVRGVLPGID